MHGMIVKKNNIFKYFSFTPCMSYWEIYVSHHFFIPNSSSSSPLRSPDRIKKTMFVMEFVMAEFNEMSRLFVMKRVQKIVENSGNHSLMIKQCNFDWRLKWGSPGVRNEKYRKFVMKVQDDRNEKDETFVNLLRLRIMERMWSNMLVFRSFLLIKNRQKSYYVRNDLPVNSFILAHKKSKEKLLCS